MKQKEMKEEDTELESVFHDICGCEVKREMGVVVQAITCKFHREV